MTNPNNAIGVNAAYGTRTSVNAMNDLAQIVSGRGILSGWAVVPKSGMTVSAGGVAGTRDVAIGEDNLGNRVCLNNRLASSVDVTVPAASVSSARYDAVVVYANNPAQAANTTPDAPSVCGIIVASGSASGVSDAQIRSAITADGGTGSTAYYAVLAQVYVGAGSTVITSANISQSKISIELGDGSITAEKIADGAVTEVKINSAFIDKLFYKSGDVVEIPVSTGELAITTVFEGHLTGGNQYFNFFIPLAKHLDNITSATIDSLVGPVRGGVGNYLTNMSTDTANLAVEATTIRTKVNKEMNGIFVSAYRSAGWGGTNNACYSFQVMSGQITLL